MKSLSGKVAVVCGAAEVHNMGQAIARRLARLGVQVVVTDCHEEPLAGLAVEIGGGYTLMDITCRADIDNAVAFTIGRHRKVDIGINAAGWGLVKPTHEMTEDELDRMCAVVEWLASDECFITGQNLQVNGSMTLRRNPMMADLGELFPRATAHLAT